LGKPIPNKITHLGKMINKKSHRGLL